MPFPTTNRMDQHLRAALAECDAELTSLAAAQQRLMDRRGFILRALEPTDTVDSIIAPTPPVSPPVPERVKAEPRRAPAKAAPMASDDRVLQALRDGLTTLKAIAKTTGLPYTRAKRALQALVQSGRVIATGNTMSRRYQLPATKATATATAADTEGDRPEDTTMIPAADAIEITLGPDVRVYSNGESQRTGDETL